MASHDPWDALFGAGELGEPGAPTATAPPAGSPDPWDDLFGAPAYAPPPAAPEEPRMSIGARISAPFRAGWEGLRRGSVATVPELAGNVLEQFGAEELGGRIEAGAERRGSRLAEQWESPRFRDAPVSWLAENLGQALPTTVPSIAGAAVGSFLGPAGTVAGAAIPAYLMGVGDIRGELEDAGMEEGAGMSALTLGGAVPYAAADILMPARVGSALASGGAKRGFGAMFRAAMRGGAEETFAEGTQSLVSQGAAAVGTGQPIDVGRIGEEAVRGGAAGVFFGGGGQAAASVLPARDTSLETADPSAAPPAPQRDEDPWDSLPDTPAVPEAVQDDVVAPEAAPAETIPSLGETTAPVPETTVPTRETDAVIPETTEAPTWARESIVDEDPDQAPAPPERRQRSIFPGDDRKVETEYTVVEADRLKASHTANYAQRAPEEFPAEIQGRAYHGQRGRQAREHTEQIVSGFDPDRALDRTSSAAEGPPIVTPSGVAVAGSGRIIAQQRLYESASERGTELKGALHDRAADFGIDPAQVAGMERPVLVRRIVDPEVDVTNVEQLRELNASSDQPIGKTKDPLSEAQGKAVQFREARGALDHFAATADPDATIRSYLGTGSGRDFLGELVDDGVISKGERARFADATTGVATEEGRQFIERMFYVAAIGDPDVISRAPPSVLRKLDTSLPAIIRADRIGGGWEIGPLVRESLDLLAGARAGDMTLDDRVAQRDFTRPAPDEHVVEMARFLESGKADVRDAFRTYANQAEAFTRGTASDDLFGFEPAGPEESQSIFGKAALAPRGDPRTALRQMLSLPGEPSQGSAAEPERIFGRREERERQEWERLGEGMSEEEAAERERSLPFIQEARADQKIRFSEEELAAAAADPDRTDHDFREIKAARRRAAKAPSKTDLIDTPERDRLRDRVRAEVYNLRIENRQQGRRAFVLLGPPGSGKSTAVANRLIEEYGALEADSDLVKERLPEFEGGLNANGVHKESAWIASEIIARAIAKGDNMVIPRVGSSGGSVRKLLDQLEAAGYVTDLYLVDLSPTLSTGRVVTRFFRGGRFVDPLYVRGTVKENPRAAYQELKSHPGVSRFTWLDQDVEMGQPPRLVEEGSNAKADVPAGGLVDAGASEGRGVPDRGRDARSRQGDRGDLRRDVPGRARPGEGRSRPGGEGEGGTAVGPSAVHPLAPTAEVSEQLRSAGTFAEGTSMEAPKATAIVRDLQKVLHEQLEGLKVAEGKLQKRGIFRRALAQVDPRAQVVRAVSLSDVASIGHEYGHLMQKLLLGASEAGGIDNATLARLPGAVRGELQDLAQGISNESLTEGWAEFWRIYLDNPDTLGAEAPNVLGHVEGLLETHPAVRNAWADAREQWKLHRDASPQARVRSHISVGEGDPDALSITGKWMRFRTNVLDDFEAIRKVVAHVRERTGDELTIEEDVETLARLSRGASGIADMFIGEKQGDRFIGGQVDFGTLERRRKSLTEILDPVEDQLDDFRDYMVARRAQELHGRDLLTGIRDEDVKWTIRHLEDRYGESFKPAFDELQEYNKALLRFLVDSGVISEETFDQIVEVNQNHVPFYRVREGGGGALGAGSGFGTLWSPVKRFKGSGRDIIDPLESILKNTYNYVQVAQNQRVSTALASLAEKPGVGDLFEQLLTPMKRQQFTVGEIEKDLKESVPGYEQLLEKLEEAGIDPSSELFAVFRPGDYHGKENTISVLEEGKRKWFEVDPELYKALEGLNTEHRDAWVRAMSAPARWLRAGATLNPAFMIRNFMRDQRMAFVQSEHGYRPVWDFALGVFEAVKKGETYEQFMVSGAHRGTMLGLDRDSQQRNLQKLLKSDGVPNVLKNPLDILRALSELSETGTRMGEFMRAREKLGESGEALQKAGAAAREVSVDFARHGAKTTALRGMAAFWNARMQGYDRLGRAVKKSPVKFMATTFASVTLPSMLLYFVNRDDPEFWEIPQWRRDLFDMVKVNDTWLSIPKPFELGLVFGTLPVRVLSAIESTPGGSEELQRFFEDTLSKELTSIGPAPTAVMPLIENLTNWSFFLQRPIVPRSEENVRDREQGNELTSEIAKLMARWSPGPEGISPRSIDNLLYSWTGGLGRLASRGVDLGVDVATGKPPGPTRQAADYPGIRGVTIRTPGLSSESVERLYRELAKARTARATLRHFEREGRTEDFEREARDPEQAELRAQATPRVRCPEALLERRRRSYGRCDPTAALELEVVHSREVERVLHGDEERAPGEAQGEYPSPAREPGVDEPQGFGPGPEGPGLERKPELPGQGAGDLVLASDPEPGNHRAEPLSGFALRRERPLEVAGPECPLLDEERAQHARFRVGGVGEGGPGGHAGR